MATDKTKIARKKPVEVIVHDTGRIPPQALDLEKVVLGALMLEKDAISNIGDILRPECFYDKRHGMIFEAIRDLTNNREPKIDMLTVIEQLKRNGNLQEAGGMLYISELTNNVTSTVHLDVHAKIIAQKHLARELIHFSGLVQGKAFDETIDIDDLMQEAESSLFEIAQRNIKKDAIQIDPIITEAWNVIKLAAQRKDGMSGIASGYQKLDRITSGWQKSDLIIIAARPAMGKTAFVLSMAKNMAVDFKIPVAVFSLEMSNIQLVTRLITNVCEIEGNKIKSGSLDKYEWDQFHSKIKTLFEAPIYVDDTPSLSVFELRTKARRLVREEKVQCIIIDYLQLMNASGMNYGSREQEVSMISRSLKGLAKELDIPIIALSQLNRGVETRSGMEGKRPQLSDLRESGAIEQDADMVCFIHRPEYYGMLQDNEGNSLEGLAEIIVAKHRNGGTGDLWLRFKKELIKFENLAEYDTNVGGYQEFTSRMNDDVGVTPQPIGSNEDFITGTGGNTPF